MLRRYPTQQTQYVLTRATTDLNQAFGADLNNIYDLPSIMVAMYILSSLYGPFQLRSSLSISRNVSFMYTASLNLSTPRSVVWKHKLLNV